MFREEVGKDHQRWKNARQIITKLAKRGDDLDEIHSCENGLRWRLGAPKIITAYERRGEIIMYPILIVLSVYMRSVSIA